MSTQTEREILPKTYEPEVVESRRYAEWEAAGVFHEEPDPARPPFVISMPPPNITGRLHMGHASTYTPMDILTRYHRMLGENAVWLPGQDHAAIATETVVIRELAKEGQTRESLGRAGFVERVWRWREEQGDAIHRQTRLLGFGPDWARDRFTMDAGLSAAVNKVFVSLHERGLLYRGTRLVNWDPVSKSTLSDAEVDDEEQDGALYHVRYASADGSVTIDVATTRPETMLGDTAIAVHPEDERYAAVAGKTVRIPLIEREIPIITDAAVERDFGTGAVKVTPAHDPTDYEIGLRHNLPMPTILEDDGTIGLPQWRDPRFDASADPGNAAAWAAAAEKMRPYVGLDRKVARELIVADLKFSGALLGVEPRRHAVPVSSRSGAVVEPMLSLQWWVSMETLARPALEAYRSGALRFIPERNGRIYESWLANIKDWNISRQVWWGHQLPVWYGPGGETFVAESEDEAYEAARKTLGADVVLERDSDTLDTWFSSGLWPFSILGWPASTPELEWWYPNSVMITARDIIFLWVARMVILGIEFIGKIPFPDVFISPLVFDKQGRKMSKSLKNGIEPLDLVRDYGADATRFGLAQQMRLESQEMRFDERFCAKARDFNNKIWNALRFAVSLAEGLPRAGTLPVPAKLKIADWWILTRLHGVIGTVERAYDAYEFGVAADAIIDFVWYQLCDWYIEATKIEAERETRGAVLSYVLNAAMRLMHPIAPFVTEEVWQALPHDGETIVTSSWPDASEVPHDPTIAAEYEAVIAAVGRVREARTALGLKSNERVILDAPADLDAERGALLAHHALGTIATGASAPAGAGPAPDPLEAVVVRAPVAQLRARYEKELARLASEIARGEAKLNNAAFTSKASPDVVSKEREKLQGYERERALTAANLAALGAPDGSI